MKTRTKLFTFAAGLVAVAGITSCSSDITSQEEALFRLAQNDNTYGRMDSEVKLYSTITSLDSQNSSKAMKAMRKTGGCYESWGNDCKPSTCTSEEKQGVLEYVQSEGTRSCKWPGYTTYFLQDVTCGNHTYEYTNSYGQRSSWNCSNDMCDLYIEEDQSKKSNWCDWEKQDWSNGKCWRHVNNFNNGSCQHESSNNCTMMSAGFKDACVKTSDGKSIDDYKIYYYDGNYYLCFDYSNNNDRCHVDKDGCYDDWIIKIIPGKGECNSSKGSTPVYEDEDEDDDSTDPAVDPTDPTDPTDPSTEPATEDEVTPLSTLTAHVEFDVHQQEHQDWNEIKTSIHLRDTVNTRIFLPIPSEYQVLADDFAIRIGNQYEYITKSITYCDRTYKLGLTINHHDDGVEILFDKSNAQYALVDNSDTTWVDVPFNEVLKAARATYYDGLTFEVHSYVYPTVDTATIWGWLKTVECLQSTKEGTPTSGDCATHTFGQATSAYYSDDQVEYIKDPE